MRQAAGQLQRTSTFKDLQSKVSSTLAQPDVIPSLVLLHIDDESQSAGTRDESCLNPPSSKLGSEHAVKSCAYLLQEHHHLKHYLKKCFNNPLPAELRRAAWKTLLQYASLAVRREKPRRYSITRFKEECKEDREISRKCESTLQSSPFFSQLARSSVIMEAMKSIMTFWSRQHPDGQLSEADFLLCIPFLCTWQSKLEREDRAPGISIRHVKQVQALLTDIAEVYVSFMEEAHVKVSKCVSRHSQCYY